MSGWPGSPFIDAPVRRPVGSLGASRSALGDGECRAGVCYTQSSRLSSAEATVPIYEYRCDACGDTFEVLQKFSDEPVETCKLCGGSVRKVLHPVAIHFKGTGFYTTDYARKSVSSPSCEAKSDAKGADAKGGDSKGGDGSGGSGSGEGGTSEFRMSEKAKSENRQKRAEKRAAASGTASSSKK